MQLEVLVAIVIHDRIQIGVLAIDGAGAFVLVKVWLLEKSLKYDNCQLTDKVLQYSTFTHIKLIDYGTGAVSQFLESFLGIVRRPANSKIKHLCPKIKTVECAYPSTPLTTCSSLLLM